MLDNNKTEMEEKFENKAISFSEFILFSKKLCQLDRSYEFLYK